MKEIKKSKRHGFEYYMKEIDRVIVEMEEGNIDQLDKLIENFEHGSNMIEKCNNVLREAELRVHRIAQKSQELRGKERLNAEKE